MGQGPRYRVMFRRRREGRTDYRTRLNLLRSGETRLVIRRTSGNIIAQFVDYDGEGDNVKATAVGLELSKLGWNGSAKNTPAAYLTGLLAGKRAMELGIDEAVLDMGRHANVRGSKVYAALKGVLDAGVWVPHGDDDMFPSEDRLTGDFLDQTNDFNAVKAKIGISAANSEEDEE